MKGDMKNMKGSSSCGSCCMGACPKCHAFCWLIVGLIFLINAYWPFADWWTLVGILFVLKGLVKMMMPTCSHCK